MKILIVDDDHTLVNILHDALRQAGYQVEAAFDLPMARRRFAEDAPDLVVLDLTLGTDSGLDLLREIRAAHDTPVLILSHLQGEDDRVEALTLGADDYLSKPFFPRELLARVQVQLRRRSAGGPAGPPPAARLSVGPLSLNPADHSAEKEGVPLDLTVLEFRLLQLLMQHANQVVPTATILKQVWGYDGPASDVVRVTARRLRQKIEGDPSQPELLVTRPGVGLMLRGG